MKLIVNRQLSDGFYRVSFKVGDFTPDEVQKMGSFGVPAISLIYVRAGFPSQTRETIPLTQISPNQVARFKSEKEAREYETQVLEQIRGAIHALRERKDDFTGSNEVAI